MTPRHIGIIMDGNGRWAKRRGYPRAVGHQAGAQAVRRITEAAARLGIRQLTLFAFSTENWKRPADEVQTLMRLFVRYLESERERLMRSNVRLRAIGRLHELAPDVQAALDEALRDTESCDGLTLCLAINYGARAELTDACRRLVALAAAGELSPDAVTERTIEDGLSQPDMPPLDLVIRTGGEMRLSNFLLWQAAYAEIWVTPVPWPDFHESHLKEAMASFAGRERRFGAAGKLASPSCA